MDGEKLHNANDFKGSTLNDLLKAMQENKSTYSAEELLTHLKRLDLTREEMLEADRHSDIYQGMTEIYCLLSDIRDLIAAVAQLSIFSTADGLAMIAKSEKLQADLVKCALVLDENVAKILEVKPDDEDEKPE